MESESDWDTQSEAVPSPRQTPQLGHKFNEAQLQGDSYKTEFYNADLFVDYSAQEKVTASGKVQQKQTPSTPKQQVGNQSQRTPRQASRQQHRSSNQNRQSSNVGGASEVNGNYHQSDGDDASVATVIESPGSRSGSARTARFQANDQRLSRDSEPPFDFSRAYKPDSASSRQSEAGQRPGRDRKGNMYDPSPFHDNAGQDVTLAELRAGMEKGKQLEDQARRKQQRENQRKQLELKNELEELAKDDLATKDKVLARVSNLASRFKGESKKDKDSGKGQNVANKDDADQESRPEKPFVVEDEGGKVMILPFEEYEREFYRTTRVTSSAVLPDIADRVEKGMRRLWQEVFALLRMLTSLLFVFIIEFVQYLFRDVIYGVVLRVISIFGDYVVKTTLSTLFNGFLQPILIFIWNVLIGLRKALEPIISLLRGISQQIAIMLGAFRLVEITYNYNNTPNYPYNNDYAYSENSDGVENV